MPSRELKQVLIEKISPTFKTLREEIRNNWNDFTTIEFIDNEADCSKELDSLIVLLNDLIPDKYKKNYTIKRTLRCK